MPIEFKEIKSESAGFIATEKLWLTKDGKIVRDGDPRAAMLLAPKGGVIPQKLATRLGLAKGITIEPLLASKPKMVAPEEIATRQTRPEKPTAER